MALESSFFACDAAHRESQSSVNCSKKGALILDGCRTSGLHSRNLRVIHERTVKVGFSIAEDVDDSTTEVDEASATSSSARTWPKRAAEEYRVESIALLIRILRKTAGNTGVYRCTAEDER